MANNYKEWISFFQSDNLLKTTSSQIELIRAECNGQFVNIFAHLIITNFKRFLLSNFVSIECTVEDNINWYKASPLSSLLFALYCDSPLRFEYYNAYLIDSLELEYLTRLICNSSLVSIIKSINEVPSQNIEMLICQISKLIQTNPERKEMFILALFELYGTFIEEEESANELAKKYVSIFQFLRKIENTGFFLQIFSQKFKSIFISKPNALKVVLYEILPQVRSTSTTTTSEILLGDDYDSIWMPDPIEAEYVKITKSFKYGDIFSIFVSLYENKNIFVEKFNLFLSDEIISSLGSGQESVLLDQLVNSNC